jgi:hypothetical protein
LNVHVPKAIAALEKAWIDAQPTIEIIKGIFEDIGEVLGTVWDWLNEKIPAAVVAVQSTFETAKDAIGDVIRMIEGFISTIQTAIEDLREFLGLSGSMSSSSGTGYVPPGQTGGGGGYVQPGQQAGGGGYVRGAMATPGITVNVYANGGNVGAVRSAANTGTLEALRARGYR